MLKIVCDLIVYFGVIYFTFWGFILFVKNLKSMSAIVCTFYFLIHWVLVSSRFDPVM